MKPVKTFLFSLCVLAVVVATHFILQQSGHEGFLNFGKPENTSGEIWGGQRLNTWKENKDTREILDLQAQWAQDSLMLLYKRIYRLEPDIFDDPYLRNIPITSFEYDSAGAGKILLYDFFARLLAMRNPGFENLLASWYEKPDFWDEPLSLNRKGFVRILHYGDSQIENDHITGTIRHLIQGDFGGNGSGLLPLFQASSGNIRLKKSGNWHTVKADKNTRRGNYGVYTAYLSPPPINTILNDSRESGSIQAELPAETANGKPLFLEAVVHADVSEKDLRISAGERVLEPVSILEAFGQKRYTYALHREEREIEAAIDLSKNHNLYALSFNDTSGVCIDNLAMRGSAGSVFSVNNRRFLTDQLHLLNTGLILYQFGINALASGHYGENDYSYYRMLLLKELSYIRTLMPGTPVIVIGIADKPLSPNSASSNPDIDLIRNIQREAAFQTGCVFWDLCTAMGGENAMSRWSNAQPALASRDLVHFTPRGADLVGKLFYKSLLDAYRQFLLQERKAGMLRRAQELMSFPQTD